MKYCIPILVAAVAAEAMSPALSADLAPSALEPAIPAAAFDWTGFYLGAHAGYGWNDGDARLDGHSDVRELQYLMDNLYPTVFGAKDLSAHGFIGGVQAGYSYRIGSFVLGLEADISYAGIKDDRGARTINDNGFSARYSQDYELKWLGTVRPRLGYAFDRTLVYVTGGLAYGEVDARHTLQSVRPDTLLQGPPYTGGSSGVKTGWTAGAGLEYALAEHWTGKVEYLYYRLADSRSAGPQIPKQAPFRTTFKADNAGHIVRLGVNYKF